MVQRDSSKVLSKIRYQTRIRESSEKDPKEVDDLVTIEAQRIIKEVVKAPRRRTRTAAEIRKEQGLEGITRKFQMDQRSSDKQLFRIGMTRIWALSLDIKRFHTLKHERCLVS